MQTNARGSSQPKVRLPEVGSRTGTRWRVGDVQQVRKYARVAWARLCWRAGDVVAEGTCGAESTGTAYTGGTLEREGISFRRTTIGGAEEQTRPAKRTNEPRDDCDRRAGEQARREPTRCPRERRTEPIRRARPVEVLRHHTRDATAGRRERAGLDE